MRRLFAFSTVLLCLSALYGCASTGTHVGRAAEPVVVKKSVRTFSLANGAALIVKEGGAGSPTAVQVWLTGGSSSDPAGMPGLSHFTEHMLFTGSLHVAPGRAEVYLESMGGKLSGHTGRDFSYIGVTIPGPGLERAMDILFDMVAYPSFRPEQVSKERDVVVQEILQRAGEPDSLLMDNLFAEAYKSHPYGNPVAGTTGGVSGFTRDDVAGYYSRTYVPSNMVVVVVGDVKADAVKAAVDKTYGRLAPVPFRRPGAGPEASQLFSRTRSVPGPVRLTYMALGWHVCAASSPDIYPLEVLRAVLGQGRGSRLYMELRERMGAAFDVESALYPLKDPGLFVVSAHLREEDIRRVTDETLRQMNKLKDEPVSVTELSRAVSNIEASHMLDTETAEGQAYALGYWFTVYGGGDPAEYMENIRKVTPEDVQKVAQKYLGEGNYTLSVVRPEGQ